MPTDVQIEAVARYLCRRDGIDPDDRRTRLTWDGGQVNNPSGLPIWRGEINAAVEIILLIEALEGGGNVG